MALLIPFIQSYGYVAVFIGSILEGESFVLIGGFSSHGTYLYFPLVVLFAALGAMAGDWLFFFLGKYKREAVFKYFPRLARMAERPMAIIEKKPRFVSFAMRFMYGFRFVMPLSIGASKIPARQFLVWNGFAAILWALIVTTAGYMTGNILESIIGEIRSYEFRIIVFTLFVVAVVILIVRLTQLVLRQRSIDNIILEKPRDI